MNTPDLSAARWRKSSHSGPTGGECVELANLTPHVAVRDSKNPNGPALVFPAAGFAAVLRHIKNGAHDLA
ncbi:protein of unknown function [Thermomonospora echinospora]|uniref:DUF397 domain-containing protein n=1 Tax=Thermomonospora echinospora TaxID=1992 RepID=A0A1H6E1E3_9ACTN|nr:DUF397 domain-containing protein [Thermomonospora echinospora]SEG90745.1 protein of unknown function [Thermomonospora echinospora]